MCGRITCPTLLIQGMESLHTVDELIQLVVMHPVTRIGKRLGFHVTVEPVHATIFHRIGSPRFHPLYQQCRAGNATTHGPNIVVRDADGGKHTYVVIELPAVRSILVLVGAMNRQVPRLLLGQMRVLFLHTLECVFQSCIASWHSS